MTINKLVHNKGSRKSYHGTKEKKFYSYQLKIVQGITKSGYKKQAWLVLNSLQYT